MGTPATVISFKMRPRSQAFTSRPSTGTARAGVWPWSAYPDITFHRTNGSNLVRSSRESVFSREFVFIGNIGQPGRRGALPATRRQIAGRREDRIVPTP